MDFHDNSRPISYNEQTSVHSIGMDTNFGISGNRRAIGKIFYPSIGPHDNLRKAVFEEDLSD